MALQCLSKQRERWDAERQTDVCACVCVWVCVCVCVWVCVWDWVCLSVLCEIECVCLCVWVCCACVCLCVCVCVCVCVRRYFLSPGPVLPSHYVFQWNDIMCWSVLFVWQRCYTHQSKHWVKLLSGSVQCVCDRAEALPVCWASISCPRASYLLDLCCLSRL